MSIQPIGGTTFSSSAPQARGASGRSFGELLKQGLEYVNRLQHRADRLMEAYAAGETDNIHELMIAITEANLVLQLTVAIRNQAIQAYQEIMRMQV